jgi:tRNA 2-thiouridine synthesizing protein E
MPAPSPGSDTRAAGAIGIARDADGCLLEIAQWNAAVAELLAREENITLDGAHWEILATLRAYYIAHEHAPAMRALVSLVRRELGAEKGNSLYLLKLFPGSPARIASKIAGLPKPEHCL